MIQDIAPHRFDNSYHPGPPSFLDIALCFSEKEVLLKNGALPHFSDLPPAAAAQSERLFSNDETGFLLAPPQAFEAPKKSRFHRWKRAARSARLPLEEDLKNAAGRRF